MTTRQPQSKRQKLTSLATNVRFLPEDGRLIDVVSRRLGLSRHAFVRMAAIQAARAEDARREKTPIAQAS